MSKSSIPAQRPAIEVESVGDTVAFAASGRMVIATGKSGPKFDPCPYCKGAKDAVVKVRGIDGASDQLVGVNCPVCNPEGGAR